MHKFMTRIISFTNYLRLYLKREFELRVHLLALNKLQNYNKRGKQISNHCKSNEPKKMKMKTMNNPTLEANRTNHESMRSMI